MLKRIHVNQHKIKSNRKTGATEPVLSVKTYKSNEYGNQLTIKSSDGTVVAKVVYRPSKPLSCGAEVWIETDLQVEIDDDLQE